MQPITTTSMINNELDQCVDSFMIKYRKLALRAHLGGMPYRNLTVLALDKMITSLAAPEEENFLVDIIVGDTYYSFETKDKTENQQGTVI